MTSTGDQHTRVSDLKNAVDAFNTARDWGQFHSPKNLAMSIAIEAAELMELFQWVNNDRAAVIATTGARRDQVAEELADVLIYCLTLANQLNLDVSTLVLHKLNANSSRYPVGQVNGDGPTPQP